MRKKLSELIKKRYIEPTKREASKCVGIEIEMPIVNLNGEAVDFSIIHDMTEKFVEKFEFAQRSRDDNGHIYLAGSEKTGDSISYDCSYNTLEISFGPEEKISVVEERFVTYVSFVQEELAEANYTLTGRGVSIVCERHVLERQFAWCE